MQKNHASNLEVKLCAFSNASDKQLCDYCDSNNEKIRAFTKKVPKFFSCKHPGVIAQSKVPQQKK